MLTLSEIKSFFPSSLHRFQRFMLREYLQCKILEIIFESNHATDLCFMGGTCLRIVHNNHRFSEDLDFDNIALSTSNFGDLSDVIQKNLEREGYKVELKTVMKAAWHCHIKFPELLYEEGLSGYREEKILIQIDTEPQNHDYEPERFVLNRFDVFTTLLTTPLSLLMAKKVYAIINRKRKKGKDFYDLVFLMSQQVKPDYAYLKSKINLPDSKSIKKALLETCQNLDMQVLAKDVEPFLFDSTSTKKIVRFEEVVRQYTF